MFYGKMEEHQVTSPTIVTDNYGHSRLSYSAIPSTALIHIVTQDRSLSTESDLLTYQGTLVGYTYDSIPRNSLVDSSMRVTSVMPHRDMNILYLQEVEDGR